MENPGRYRRAAGGEDLLEFLPASAAERACAAAAEGETNAALWHRHVDGTGGHLLRVRRGPGPLLAVMNSHNMAFYVWEEAVRRGLVRPGAHALHVDYHPDFFDPEEVMPPDTGSEQSFEIARGLKWNDWITAAFARGAIDRLTDVSRGDFGAHEEPYVAVTVDKGTRYVEAGPTVGEPHPYLLRLDAPVSGRYRLLRPDGLIPDTIVLAETRHREAPGDTPGALDLAQRISTEGRRLEPRDEGRGEISVALDEGTTWLLVLAPGDEASLPPPLSARFDPDGTEEETGVPIRRLRRDVTTLEALEESPPEIDPRGLILDVDLDWLNVHREDGKPDEETVTEECVAEFVRVLHRIAPEPGVVTVALSPDCLSPSLQARDLEEAGIRMVKPPPEWLGMAEGRRRLALFLRAWREVYEA